MVSDIWCDPQISTDLLINFIFTDAATAVTKYAGPGIDMAFIGKKYFNFKF